MKKIEAKAGGLKRKIRNRMRSVTKRVIAIARPEPQGVRGRRQTQKGASGTADLK
jgi:hypothetical protein